MEQLLSIAALFQGLAAAATFIIFFVKPVRHWFLGVKERRAEQAEDDATEKESVKCLLRSEIVRIYYANRERRSLHSFEYENVAMLYHAYKEMGGNSFVDRIWEEISEWDIIP
jgi:hypothetical protein